MKQRDVRLRVPSGVPLAACVLLAGACVSKARYDEATTEVKYYQRLYQDLESFQGNLEAENERLRGELELLGGVGPAEAGLTREIDERMKRLEAMAANLGGGPGEVTVLRVEGGYGLRLSDSILFDSGSTVIHSEGRELLLRMAAEIASRPHRQVWVRGHTDTDPIVKTESKLRFPHGNIQLSAERAIEVASLLVREGGIDERRIVVAGFGPSEPVARNDSATNKRRNRRVEIYVLDEGAAGSE